jgi:hypothetical protein
MRKVDGWQSLAEKPSDQILPIRSLTSPHDAVISSRWRLRQNQFQHKPRRHLPREPPNNSPEESKSSARARKFRLRFPWGINETNIDKLPDKPYRTISADDSVLFIVEKVSWR